MGLRINTNVASLGVQSRALATSNRLNQSLGRLASGLRVRGAADDASGLARAERLRSEARSLAVAERNIQDGIAFARIAEAVANEVQAAVSRVRELTLQALNGTASDEDRELLQVEYAAVVERMRSAVESSEFNGISVFDRPRRIEVQVGADSGQTVEVRVGNLVAVARRLATLDLRSPELVLPNLDRAEQFVAANRSRVGTAEARLESALRRVQVTRENFVAAESRIRDVDVAEETASVVKEQILLGVGVTVLAQANLTPAIALVLLPGTSASGGLFQDSLNGPTPR